MSVNSNGSASNKVMHEEHKATQRIPTIVNGEQRETVNCEVELLIASNKETWRKFMSDLIMQLANKRNSHSSKKNISLFAY